MAIINTHTKHFYFTITADVCQTDYLAEGAGEPKVTKGIRLGHHKYSHQTLNNDRLTIGQNRTEGTGEYWTTMTIAIRPGEVTD